MNDYLNWFKFAKEDLKAAGILHKKRLFPQSLYFLHQSLEKMLKGDLLSYGYIKKGKEIGHNFSLGYKKILEHYMKKKIVVLIDDINFKEVEGDSKEYSEKFSKLITFIKQDKDLVKMIQRVKSFELLNKQPLKFEEKELIKIITKLDNLLEKAEISRKELINVIDSLKEENNYSMSFKKIKYGLLDFHDYYTSVLASLSLILPNSEIVRYPENNPDEIYNKLNPVIKYFDLIELHLRSANKFGKLCLFIVSLNKKRNK